jgi:hypothetical protein
LSTPRTFNCVVVAALVVKMWLTSAFRILPVYAPHDAANYLEHGKNFARGHWWGAYNDLTLIKGPMMAIYLALVQEFGVPLTLAHTLLYAFVCYCACRAIRPLISNWAALATIFVLLFFNPIEMNGEAWLSYRSQLNPSLALLTVACAVAILVRRREPIRKVAVWWIGLSVSFSAFWLTREEALWIIPCLAIVLGAYTWSVFRASWATNRRVALRRAAMPLLPLVTCVFAIEIFAALNGIVYGWPTVVELQSPEFIGAYNSLARIVVPNAVTKYPVPRAARALAYSVSPAARELEPAFEGAIGAAWIQNSCFWSLCTDIGGGWFIWSLRDATANAGHYHSGADARAFYRQLAAELDAACDRKAIPCRSKGYSLAPPVAWSDVPAIFANWAWGINLLVSYAQLEFEPWHISGPFPLRGDYEFVVGSVSDGVGGTEYKGWLVHTPLQSVAIELPNGTKDATPLIFLPSPDVATAFAKSKPRKDMDATNARFDVETSCGSGCKLDLQTASGHVYIPLDPATMDFSGPGVLYHLDLQRPLEIRAGDASIKGRMLDGIGRTYQRLVPVMVVLALTLVVLRLCFAFIRRSRPPYEHVVVGLGVVASGSALMAILALIATLSFPGLTPEYMGGMFPLMLLASSLVLWIEGRLGFSAILERLPPPVELVNEG